MIANLLYRLCSAVHPVQVGSQQLYLQVSRQWVCLLVLLHSRTAGPMVTSKAPLVLSDNDFAAVNTEIISSLTSTEVSFW